MVPFVGERSGALSREDRPTKIPHAIGMRDVSGVTHGLVPLPRRMEPLAFARCSDSPDPRIEYTVAGQCRSLTGFPWTSNACIQLWC